MNPGPDGTIPSATSATSATCGITGFLDQGTRENRREILGPMTGSPRHRGSGEEGVFL